MKEKEKIELSDDEIEKVCSLAALQLSHCEKIEKMSHPEQSTKQIAILMLESLESQKEADLLVSNLTNQNGPIREACALKIAMFIENESFKKFFQKEEILNTFLKAINDINPNVCRQIAYCLKFLERQDFLQNKIVDSSLVLLHKVRLYTNCKKYKVNKDIFALFWNLEALSNLQFEIDENFKKLISLSSLSSYYTIREKAAKIVCKIKIQDELFEKLRFILKHDENFYVRRFFETRE